MARHVFVAFLVVGVLWFIAERTLGLGTRVRKFVSPTRGRALVVLSVVILVSFLTIAIWYLNLDGFAGEVEPMVSCLSWLIQTGHPLYTDFDAAERYSVLYGPSVFLTNGLFLKVLGPSLTSAKLASLLGVIGSLVFLFGAIERSSRRYRESKVIPLTMTGLAVLFYWCQGFAVYLVRPDSLLLFSVAMGLFAAVRSSRWLAVLTVGVAAGFGINLKIHGLVYFLPILVLITQRFGWKSLTTCLVLAGVVTAAPFALHPQIDAGHYISWLRSALSHGLDGTTLSQTVRFGMFLLFPIALVLTLIPMRRLVIRENRWLLGSLLATTALSIFFSAKPGAGLVHLLPMVPSAVFVLAVVLERGLELGLRDSIRRPVPQSALAAVLLTALLSGSVNEYRAVKLLHWQQTQTPNLTQDLRQVMARYPTLKLGMACGGENVHFRYTWFRPLLVFANHPLLVDPISVMDAQLSGLEFADETYRALSDGAVQLWLVPKSQTPFRKLNWYAPHDELFPDRFVNHFLSWYSLKGQSEYFDLWFWNGLDGADGEVVQESLLTIPAAGHLAP